MRDVHPAVDERLDALIERALKGELFDDPPRDVEALLDRAEAHGVLGVVEDALGATDPSIDPQIRDAVARRSVARELDHAAHLGALRRIDDGFSDAGIFAVALKGALLGSRLYRRPWTRATTDIDLLVADEMLLRSDAELRRLGYVGADGPDEDRFRREHFHLHYSHLEAPLLELHFHAFRGFGRIMQAGPLIARRRRMEGFAAIGVLAPEDELVYLAVHAAAHRFIRLGWLYDLRLLVERMSEAQVALAASRANEVGYARVVAFAADLLIGRLGVSAARVAPLRARRGAMRSFLARTCMPEPANAFARSGTRFAYSLALCGSTTAAVRYAASASVGYTKRVVRLGR